MSDDPIGGDLYTVLGSIAQDALSRPESDPRAMAEKGVRAIQTTLLRELAVRSVIRTIESVRRAEARRVEELAVRTRALSRTSEPGPPVAAGPVTAENWMAVRDPRHHSNVRERRRWQRDMGDRFVDWFYLAEEFVEQHCDEDQREMFAEDWHPGGVRARQREVTSARIRDHIVEMAKEIRLEVTEDLLGTYFALGDGRRVTWGLATVEEHEARVAMLTGQAAATTETAARHVAAIDMLQEGGVSCLAEIRGSRAEAA